MTDISKKIIEGSVRAASRAISLIENEDPIAESILENIHAHTGDSFILGITGPPGVGKSTLTDKLIIKFRENGKKVGVIAVDPTSPFSGGALLGDRIRMQNHAADPGVFIRSMGSRGNLGGLSNACSNAIKIMEAYGCEIIIIETVGVGQTEIDIVNYADTVLMVLVPELGDDIQAMKAGIMEIGDIFVINKADLDFADKAVKQIEQMLHLAEKELDFTPPIVKVIARNNIGFDELFNEIGNHKQYLLGNNLINENRAHRDRTDIRSLIERKLSELTGPFLSDEHLDSIISRESANPYKLADKAWEEIIKSLR